MYFWCGNIFSSLFMGALTQTCGWRVFWNRSNPSRRSRIFSAYFLLKSSGWVDSTMRAFPVEVAQWGRTVSEVAQLKRKKAFRFMVSLYTFFTSNSQTSQVVCMLLESRWAYYYSSQVLFLLAQYQRLCCCKQNKWFFWMALVVFLAQKDIDFVYKH